MEKVSDVVFFGAFPEDFRTPWFGAIPSLLFVSGKEYVKKCKEPVLTQLSVDVGIRAFEHWHPHVQD